MLANGKMFFYVNEGFVEPLIHIPFLVQLFNIHLICHLVTEQWFLSLHGVKYFYFSVGLISSGTDVNLSCFYVPFSLQYFDLITSSYTGIRSVFS